jgi:hypothetical protein
MFLTLWFEFRNDLKTLRPAEGINAQALGAGLLVFLAAQEGKSGRPPRHRGSIG